MKSCPATAMRWAVAAWLLRATHAACAGASRGTGHRGWGSAVDERRAGMLGSLQERLNKMEHALWRKSDRALPDYTTMSSAAPGVRVTHPDCLPGMNNTSFDPNFTFILRFNTTTAPIRNRTNVTNVTPQIVTGCCSMNLQQGLEYR